MKVGDVVIPIGACRLACGCGVYQFAIVAIVEPFALASVDADMLWTCTIEPEHVMSLCQAAPDIVARAVARYEAHLSNNAPQRMARPSAGATYAGGDGSTPESKGDGHAD